MDRNTVIRTILVIIMVVCFGYLIFNQVATKLHLSGSDDLSSMKKKESGIETEKNNILSVESRHYEITKEDKILPEYKSLYQKNKNLIGWLKIDDTNIDYPVMQSINGKGEFYLNHNYDGEEDRNGTLFMDDGCDALEPSDNLIIYGHNMKSGLMFGGLSNYKSRDFYEQHKNIKFDTIYKKGIYEVAFVFATRVYSEADITFKYYQFIEPNSKEEFDSGIREMTAMSLYDTGVKIEYGDELISLSTCDYDESNGRFVVVAKRVK